MALLTRAFLNYPLFVSLTYHNRAVGVDTTNMHGLLSYDVIATLKTHQQHTRMDVLLPFVPVKHRYYSNCWYRPDVERLNKCVLEASPEDLPILLDDMERLAAARAEVRLYRERS